MAGRGIAPVVGIVLMIVITLLLASMIAVGMVHLGEFSDENERVDELLNERDHAKYYPDAALIPTKPPGESPRTSGDEVLEFRLENTRDEQVTIEAFEIDASGIDAGITVNDTNAEEVEIRRGAQIGKANRKSSPSGFDADGTRYHLEADSDEGQIAILEANQDDGEIDIRVFSQPIGELEFTDSEAGADLIINLILDDGSKHGFYFSQ